jgi:hypothetical protein
MRSDSFDNIEPCIKAKDWVKDWLQSENPVTMTLWRKQVGIEGTRQRNFTRRQAFLFAVRSQLKQVCVEAKMKKPRDKDMDVFDLEEVGTAWMTVQGVQSWAEAIDKLKAPKTEETAPIEILEEVLGKAGLGKSETNKRRILKKAGISTSLNRGRRLNRVEAMSIILAVKL